MPSIASISSSGLQAAQTSLQVSANNIANANTDGYKRQQVIQQEALGGGGVNTSIGRAAKAGAALESDVVAQLQSKNAFLANLAVFKTSNRIAGVLLDKKA